MVRSWFASTIDIDGTNASFLPRPLSLSPILFSIIASNGWPALPSNEVGVFLMVLYVVCLDQASQGLVLWLGGGSPLTELLPFKLVGDMIVAGGDDMVIPGAYA